MFSQSRKMNIQTACFPCAVATLLEAFEIGDGWSNREGIPQTLDWSDASYMFRDMIKRATNI